VFSNLAVDALFVGSAGNFGESRRSQGQEQQPITDYPERAGLRGSLRGRWDSQWPAQLARPRHIHRFLLGAIGGTNLSFKLPG
jgi:hypothetical protein